MVYDRERYPEVFGFVSGDFVTKQVPQAIDDVFIHPRIAGRLEINGKKNLLVSLVG
ncbi:hypothetical protein KKC1_34760 [Calderihabitans maritimus]|uniref:Uncharacterized protein n=1 Tax=Calderihabitans maritimus TaxID=1246530 RepID=A0A1Z5HYL1_9FIRM|nr:hypothetical protein KKC1_34760 [Calderihabitans maritimus]